MILNKKKRNEFLNQISKKDKNQNSLHSLIIKVSLIHYTGIYDRKGILEFRDKLDEKL